VVAEIFPLADLNFTQSQKDHLNGRFGHRKEKNGSFGGDDDKNGSGGIDWERVSEAGPAPLKAEVEVPETPAGAVSAAETLEMVVPWKNPLPRGGSSC
jgi:hypothetical protein